MRSRIGRTVLVLPLSVFGRVLEKWVERDTYGNEVARWMRVKLDREFPSVREKAIWDATPYDKRPLGVPGPTLVHDLPTSDLCFKCPTGQCGKHNRLRSDAASHLVKELHDL